MPSSRWKVVVRPSSETSQPLTKPGSNRLLSSSRETRPGKSRLRRYQSRMLMPCCGSMLRGSPGPPERRKVMSSCAWIKPADNVSSSAKSVRNKSCLLRTRFHLSLLSLADMLANQMKYVKVDYAFSARERAEVRHAFQQQGVCISGRCRKGMGRCGRLSDKRGRAPRPYRAYRR